MNPFTFIKALTVHTAIRFRLPFLTSSVKTGIPDSLGKYFPINCTLYTPGNHIYPRKFVIYTNKQGYLVTNTLLHNLYVMLSLSLTYYFCLLG